MSNHDDAPPAWPTCPVCRRRFIPFLRWMVARSEWPWWAQLLPLQRWRRAPFSLICWNCKSIVGHEYLPVGCTREQAIMDDLRGDGWPS